MVPGTTIAERVLAGVKLRSTWLTDGHADVSSVEGEALAREFVQVWGVCIAPAVYAQVVIGAIIGEDDQKIGPHRRRQGQTGEQQ